MNIRTRLWLLVTALLCAVLAANGLLVLGIETRSLRRDFERESLSFARLAGPLALRAFGEAGRSAADPELGERLRDLAAEFPPLRGLALLSPRGKALAATGKETFPPVQDFEDIPPEGRMRYLDRDGGRLLEVVLPVRGRSGSPAVYVQALVGEEEVLKRIGDIRLVYGASLAVLLLLGAALALRVAGAILGPVEALRRAALTIRDGDLSARVPEAGSGEIAELARTFNAMARQVEEHRAALEQRNADVERAYAELQALQQELTALERMAAVGRTASAVSHEIDNPIGVILGTAGMLRKEMEGRGGLAEDLALIEAEALRCRRIVRDLLDFARPSARGAGPVDIPPVVELLLRGLGHHPEFREIRFRVAWSEDMPPAFADPDGVKQVLLNLLLNAAKSMGGKGEIAVLGGADAGRVRVSVLDRGPGVSPERRERIFEPFFTTGPGSGLGLSVSRRIVEQAGGRLWMEPREGGGSAFHAEWPRD